MNQNRQQVNYKAIQIKMEEKVTTFSRSGTLSGLIHPKKKI